MHRNGRVAAVEPRSGESAREARHIMRAATPSEARRSGERCKKPSRVAARSVGREAAHIGPRSGPQDRASEASFPFLGVISVPTSDIKFLIDKNFYSKIEQKIF